GGMFSVLKVREGLAAGDYRDPGWYSHPAGTIAREWTGEVSAPAHAPPQRSTPAAATAGKAPAAPGGTPTPWQARKPAGGGGGHQH
ncbi:MAG: hypothetical protein Q7U26_14475, partial [Aquabacterium sp.]|nr:hypothetical protein [Aquabacterium sp.]